MFVQVLVIVAATHSATPCGDVYSPHQQWVSALSATQESTFVRFPSPAPDLAPCVKILRFMASVSEIRQKWKGWISPAFGAHLTFLKISRIRGTQTAKPMIEAKAESE